MAPPCARISGVRPVRSEYQLEPKSAPRIAHRLPSGIRTTIPMHAERGGGAGLAARKFGHEQRRGEPIETAPRPPSHDGAERIAAEPNHSIDRVIAAQRFLEGQKELAGILVEARLERQGSSTTGRRRKDRPKRRTTARPCARHPARSRTPQAPRQRRRAQRRTPSDRRGAARLRTGWRPDRTCPNTTRAACACREKPKRSARGRCARTGTGEAPFGRFPRRKALGPSDNRRRFATCSLYGSGEDRGSAYPKSGSACDRRPNPQHVDRPPLAMRKNGNPCTTRHSQAFARSTARTIIPRHPANIFICAKGKDLAHSFSFNFT